MIKIQNLIRLIIFFAVFSLADSTFSFGQLLSADKFEEKLKSTQNPQLIDVRTATEFGAGHMVSAKNMMVSDADFQQQIIKLDKTQPVFIYCQTGERSKKTAEILALFGFNQIFELEGGFAQWLAANKAIDVVTKTINNVNGKFSKQEISDLIRDNKLVLIDYFATWCAPCKKMDPAIQRLKKEFDGKVKVIKIDTDKNRTIAIQSLVNELPTFVFYKNGKEFWRGVGEQDEDFLQELFELNAGK